MPEQYDAGKLYDLCRQASTESDSRKLLELVKKINELLDRKDFQPSIQGEAKCHTTIEMSPYSPQ